MSWIKTSEKKPKNNETVIAVIRTECGRKYVMPLLYSVDIVLTHHYGRSPVWKCDVGALDETYQVELWQSLPEVPEDHD